MKNYLDQKKLTDYFNPYPTAKEWLSQGEQLFPFVWDCLLELGDSHLVGRDKLSELVELAEIASSNGVYLPEDVLIYLLDNSGRIKCGKLLKHHASLIEFFASYREKHSDERWGDRFVNVAVQQTDFLDLFTRFKFNLTPQAQIQLVGRDDFITIIDSWPLDNAKLTQEAESDLVLEPIDKLLAYCRKSKSLSSQAFSSLCQTANGNDDNITSLLNIVEYPAQMYSHEAMKNLLARKNTDLTLLLVEKMDVVKLDQEEQRLLLDTQPGNSLIVAYSRMDKDNKKLFNQEYQLEVLQRLQADPSLSAAYVAMILHSGVLDQQFVDWLVAQPDDYIQGLTWKRMTDYGERGHNVLRPDFWLMTLKTPKALLFMKMYKSITVDDISSGLRPIQVVLEEMLKLPNAVELIALWDRELRNSQGHYYTLQYRFPEKQVILMAKSRDVERIKSIASKQLKADIEKYQYQ